MKIDQGFGCEEALDGEGFKGSDGEIGQELGELGVICEAFDFDGDEFGFKHRNASQAPCAVDVIKNGGDVFGRFGGEAVEDSGAKGFELGGELRGQDGGFGSESVGERVEGAGCLALRSSGSGGN